MRIVGGGGSGSGGGGGPPPSNIVYCSTSPSNRISSSIKTEQSIWPASGTGLSTLPANWFAKLGQSLEVILQGQADGSASNNSLQYAFYVGPMKCNTPYLPLPAGKSNMYELIQIWIRCVATGANGALDFSVYHIASTVSGSSTYAAPNICYNYGNAWGPIDLTQPLPLQLTGLFTGSPSDSTTVVNQFIVKAVF